MELNALELTVTDRDLRGAIDTYAGDGLPVSDIEARFDADGLTVTGKYQAGPLKGSFAATVSLQTDAHTVIATLEKLDALGPFGGMFKGAIVSALLKKLGDLPGISGEKNAVRCDIRQLLAARGLDARFETLDITQQTGKLTLRMSGSIDAAV